DGDEGTRDVAHRKQILGQGAGDNLADSRQRRVYIVHETTSLTKNSGEVAGKSSRLWAPRLSSRARAACTSAQPASARLRTSGSAATRATSARPAAVASSEAASRSTPAPAVIVRWSRDRSFPAS